MIAFAGKSVPDGWLLCNGALVSRKTYSRLFAAIGTAWGAGNGSTTFKLPDADGRVMQGVTDASKVGQYIEAGLPNITGAFANPVFNKDNGEPTGCFSYILNSELFSKYGDNGRTTDTIYLKASTSSSIYGGTNTVQSPALQTLIIIKA
nr:MAG TPA: tail collar fiber protein [Caudoviricetes sp.]